MTKNSPNPKTSQNVDLFLYRSYVQKKAKKHHGTSSSLFGTLNPNPLGAPTKPLAPANLPPPGFRGGSNPTGLGGQGRQDL